MEGQIIDKGIKQRTGEHRWLVRVFVGRDESGRKRYRSQMVLGTRREAQRVLRELLAERDQGVGMSKLTKDVLNHYLDKWLETHKTAVIARTYNTSIDMLNRYIRPTIGTIRLEKLSPLDIQGLYGQLQTRGISPATIRRAHATLSGALKQAVKWRIIIQNPASQVALPKVMNMEMKCMTQDEVKRFLDVCLFDQYGLLFEFMVITGVRPGEGRGLQWSDLDFHNRRVHIQRTVTEGPDGIPVLGPPKTRNGNRSIPLSARLIESLVELRTEQQQHAAQTGKTFSDDALVFATKAGSIINDRNLIQRHFKPLLKAAGLPSDIRLYDLRHTCATLLLKAGVNPKIVSERLGHSSVSLTLDTYSHVLPDMQQSATETLEDILFRD